MKLQYFYYAKRREETAMKQLWKRNAVVGTILVFVCAAIFLNGKYAEKVDKPTKVLGQSELVSTDGDAAEVSANAEGKDYFASARLTRQQARDSALSLLKEASENDDVDAETASEAAKSIETLASYTLSEAQIENMVTAKGYEDCVVFMSEDGVSVVVSTGEEGLQTEDIARITELFGEMPALYIADGHHRSAAAALVGAEKAKQNPDHKGDEEYNYFMAVCFPANQLTIIDYNRVVKDLNGLTEEQFVERLTKNFVVEEKGSAIYKPGALHNFSLYLGGKWYSLTAKPGTYDDNDPIGVLDVTISSNLILDEILGIKDLRSDKRIDFVGGIRGLGELKRRVDSGEMKVALALYPVTMKQLMDIADTGNIMPPKTTWFEPKLRSGLVIHKLD